MAGQGKRPGRMSKGDAAAWKHAVESGRLDMLSYEEARQLTLILLYTREEVDGEGSTTEADMKALLAWASDTRTRAGLLDAVLDGALYVRMRDGEPVFSLSPKGEADAKRTAEEMGLPDGDSEAPNA